MKKVTRVPAPPPRRRDAHKGDFGHVLVVGGALGMSGSVALCGRSAGRAGAGLVTVACPARSQPIVAMLTPEALTMPLPERPDGRIEPAGAARVFRERGGRWSVLAGGCGWGAADEPFAAESVALLEQLADAVSGPAVIDADGCNLLAATGRLARSPWPNLVLTPHPGELGRLLGCSAGQVQADRLAAARRAVERLNVPVLVLKGAGTLVTDGDRCYVNRTGNAGMASGGTGDVLTGVLAGLLAGGMDLFDAAVLAVHVHGLAGDLAARKLGQISLIAGDLVDFLGEAFKRVRAARRR